MKANKSKPKSGSFRVISGQWRGRRLQFRAADGLRPSTDRVRETLFNWLMYDIKAARCLDMFAGAGALGIEALSRGAASVTFCELNKQAARTLQENLKLLQAETGTVLSGDCFQSLKPQPVFDLVFIDPPFNRSLLKKSLELLKQQRLVHADSKIYCEFEQGLQVDDMFDEFEILKHKQAGQVVYMLLTPKT